MKSQSGFPVIETSGEYHVKQIRNGAFKRVRKSFAFCNIATPEQNEAGFYGLVEFHTGDLMQCVAAALHASHFGDAFVVEHIAGKQVVAEFENGTEVAIGATRFAS